MDYKDYEIGNRATNFWFAGRIEQIDQMLSKFYSGNKGLKILSIGAGTGEELGLLSKYGQVYVIDIDKRALELIPKGLCREKKVCDATKLSYKSQFFDVVVAFDVFEHIASDTDAFSESYRVLKKGGRLFFSVPAFKRIYSSHDKALEHKRRYSRTDLANKRGNFSIERMYYWNSFLFVPICMLRLARRNAKRGPDNFNMPRIIDDFFLGLLRTENWLIRAGIYMPFGLSLFCIYQK